jgi:hypothetical protein
MRGWALTATLHHLPALRPLDPYIGVAAVEQLGVSSLGLPSTIASIFVWPVTTTVSP